VVDPISAWNWQRRLMFVVAAIGVTVSVIATKHSPWPVTASVVGMALLFAIFVRLIVWILPGRPPSDIYVPEQVVLAAGASFLGLGILAQRFFDH